MELHKGILNRNLSLPTPLAGPWTQSLSLTHTLKNTMKSTLWGEIMAQQAI